MSGTVIVGGGLAAVRTADQLRRQAYHGGITIVGNEPHPPYDRPPLSKELLRGDVDDVALKPAEFYTQHHITLRLGAAAERVDTAARTLTLADGAVLDYDQLIIATGLVPRRIPADQLDGVHVLRSLDDSLALRRHAAAAQRAVIIGAGFIGCEVAASLRTVGVDVVLVEPQPAPLASVLGTQVGDWVTRLHQGKGVTVRTGVTVAEIDSSGVILSDGSELPADLVVVGIGSLPAVQWLAGSGIAVDDGVVCDASGRTNAPDVWALGDVARWAGKRVEHWSNVAEQARVLVAAMLGLPSPARGIPYFWSDQYDVKIQCFGATGGTVHLVHDDEHSFLAYHERDGALVGVAGAGVADKLRQARAQIASGTPISDMLALA